MRREAAAAKAIQWELATNDCPVFSSQSALVYVRTELNERILALPDAAAVVVVANDGDGCGGEDDADDDKCLHI